MAQRNAIASWIVVAALAVIGLGFFRLQVLGKDRYEFQSLQNRVRPVLLPAPRGLITDRNGAVLAENVPGYTISLIASSPDSLRSTLQRVADLIGLDEGDISTVLQRPRTRLDDPVIVMRDAPFAVVSALEERRVAFPGLNIQAEPKRRYPYGEGFAHVLGYVNEVTQAELEAGNIEGARYGTLVGRSGIEGQYDHLLRGQDGWRYLEVDAFGRTVRWDVLDQQDPAQGQTVRTTLDADLQTYMRETFPDGSRGAIMAMDPRNGDVLGLWSSPSFDPNAFVGGIDPVLWRAIRDSEDNPLLNRAVQGRYPPASPWKLAVAAMALRRGLVTMDTRMPTACHGGLSYYTRYFRCWRVQGHGALTLAEAIQHSCDVYFYQLGLRLDLPNLLEDAVSLGFAETTGIDLPSEARSFIPSSTEYYDATYGPRGWTSAVTLNLAIGQGENDQTLVNMVRFYASLATEDGLAPQPRLNLDAPVTKSHSTALNLDSADLYQLRRSLVTVVEGGTARASRIRELEIAGKTGTAQNPQGEDHGWFIAFAPADEPQIVVGAIVEFGLHGSSVAPMVTRVIARHLLGGDDSPDRPIRLVVPADSVPESVPIADSALVGR
jgi:penicillin-binding protein 2